jgi:hypothetical protein
MPTRSAEASIKGYYYQFDTSILQILNLPRNSDSITIEGIEDIDLYTTSNLTTVQCKYLSKPYFINSVVREPITFMLDHFVNPATPDNLHYVLYAHFENEAVGENTIDLERFKAILTYKEKGVNKCHYIDSAISEVKLSSFLAQFKIVFSEKLEDQQKQVRSLLKRIFSCTESEADYHFYNNALRIIIEKAILPNEIERRINKQEFIRAIDCRATLFTPWYIRFRSMKEYLHLISNTIKSVKALDPSKTKFIFIGEDILTSENSVIPIVALIENLISKYYKASTALRSAKPLTLIIDCSTERLLEIKKRLITSEIQFNDGYEHICFNSSVFNKMPLLNLTKNLNRILHASFYIKIISLQTFSLHKSEITIPKVIFHFSKSTCPLEKDESYQWFDMKYCENFNDISKLLI